MLLPDVKALLEDMGHAFADQLEDEERGDYLPSDEFDANGTATSPLGRHNYNAITAGLRTAMALRLTSRIRTGPTTRLIAQRTGHSARTENVSEIRTHPRDSGEELHASRFVLESCAFKWMTSS